MTRLLAPAAAAFAVMLAACGGGGGGGGGGSSEPPPVAPDGRAALTAANAERAATLALNAGTAPLSVAQQLVADLLALHDEREPLTRSACGGVAPGSIERRWTDADGNGRLSPGDTAEWRVVRCSRDGWSDDLEATALIRVRLTRVGSAVDWGVAGSVEFAEPLVAPRLLAGGAGTRLVGSFDFDAQTGGDAATLSASASARNDLAIETPGSPERRALRGFVLQKNVSWTAARIELLLRGTLESSELGGTLDIATPQPLRAWLDTLPEQHAGQGRVVLTGRGAVRIGAGPGDGTQWRLEFDRDGDGGTDEVSAAAWSARADGFLFRDPRSRLLTNPRPFAAGDLRLQPIYERDGALRAGQPLRVQFSRPIEPGSFPAGLVLRDEDTPGPGLAEQRDLAYTLRLDGALATFTPALPFKWASSVSLRWPGVAPSAPVRAREGGGTLEPQRLGGVGSVIPPVILAAPQAAWTVLEAGQSLTLDGSGSGARVSSWRWSQVGGPALVFANPDAAVTTVQLAPGASGLADLRLRLTVTDAVGQTSSRDLVRSALATGTVPTLLRHRRSSGGNPLVDTLVAEGSGGRLTASAGTQELGAAFVRQGEVIPTLQVSFRLAGSDTLAPGRYTLPGGMATGPLLVLSGQAPSLGCDGAGEVVVHALRRAPDGSLAELALDADRACGSNDRQRVSLRVGSLHPLPP